MTYCEIPEFYRERWVYSKKIRICCETGLWIQPGVHHWACTGKWHGKVETHRQTDSAYHFARHLNLDFYGECTIGFGAVDEHMRLEAGVCPYARPTWEAIKSGSVRWYASDKLPSYGKQSSVWKYIGPPHDEFKAGLSYRGIELDDVGPFFKRLVKSAGTVWLEGYNSWHQFERTSVERP